MSLWHKGGFHGSIIWRPYAIKTQRNLISDSEWTRLLHRDRGHLPSIVAYTYFCLSIISLLALLLCLYIFCSFRSLSCPRLTVHKHLMVSFILFYFSIIVYLEPYVSFREGLDYRDIVSIYRRTQLWS